MALPAAMAALIILAGVAALANVSATAAIRESRARREVAAERAQYETIRARAAYQLSQRTRGELLASAIGLGPPDTSMVTLERAWPWHTVTVLAGGRKLYAEVARAATPALSWCAAVVYANHADVATGSVVLPPLSSCFEKVAVSIAFAAEFYSVLVADLAGVGVTDSMEVDGAVVGVVRAGRVLAIAGGADIRGLVIAPVVVVQDGARVQGMIFARDSVSVAPGAQIIADSIAVAETMRSSARLVPLGRRGMLRFP
jgi:type II secretory pathway pseudopilin PulG